MAKDEKSIYYDAGGIETIDIIKAKLTEEQFKGWLLGNCIKYSARANFKGSFKRDMEKVVFYSKELALMEEKEKPKPMPFESITLEEIERSAQPIFPKGGLQK